MVSVRRESLALLWDAHHRESWWAYAVAEMEREGVSLSGVLGAMGLLAARASAERAARRARRAAR